MSIAEALRTTAVSLGWSPAKVAAVAGVSEAAARRWMNGSALPRSGAWETLRRDMPGLKERLESGSAATAVG